MAHCEKFKLSDAAGMFIHYDRTPGKSLSNKDIDIERSHLNYNLAADLQPLPQRKFLSIRLSNVQTTGRKTQNVFCDWVITQPEEVKTEDSRRFFETAYGFLVERYGEKNVISSYVHMDEIGNTPHMHFCFIPVQRLENGTEKVNAKEVINRTELMRFHPELQEIIDKALGYHVSILNGKTKEQGGNKTVKQLKAETELKKTIPQGKKRMLSSERTYTEAEDKQLKDLAADGVAYRVEIETINEKKKDIEESARALNNKARDIKEKEELIDKQAQINEERAKLLGAPSAENYQSLNEHCIELENRIDQYEDDFITIADNVGSDILKEIPVKTIQFNYKAIHAEPSERVMNVIADFFKETIEGLKEELEHVKDLLYNTVQKIIRHIGLHDDPELIELGDELLEDTEDVLCESETAKTHDESDHFQRKTI